MLTLHLGVIDVPYTAPPEAPRKVPKAGRRRTKPRATRSPGDGTVKTTGDIASILEAKYHIMEIYYEENQQRIADAIAESLVESQENLLMGAPATADPFAAASADLDTWFKTFLSQKELDKLGYPGIPTQAAIEGVSHRFANRKGPPNRPSFIDTGLYEANFHAWVD